MAIYTGGMKQEQEARAASKRIAAQQRKAQAGEAKRKGRAGLFGKIGGTLLGAAAVGLTGLTGGLAAPLVMGIASSLGKKWASDASKKGIFKTPGQVSKIEAGGEYGYGREEAAAHTKALQESRKTEFSGETMLGDIAGSYLSAGMAGKLGGAKGLLKGDLSFGEALTTGSKDAWKFGGVKGMKSELGNLISFKDEGGDEIAQDYGASQADLPLTQEELGASAFTPGGMGEMETLAPGQLTTTGEFGDVLDEEGFSIEREGGLIYQQGGQVIDQHTLLGLAILSEMGNQKKAHDDTPLEDVKQRPSIAEMFASKGKTLGGNNTQSLSQMLGR